MKGGVTSIDIIDDVNILNYNIVSKRQLIKIGRNESGVRAIFEISIEYGSNKYTESIQGYFGIPLKLPPRASQFFGDLF